MQMLAFLSFYALNDMGRLLHVTEVSGWGQGHAHRVSLKVQSLFRSVHVLEYDQWSWYCKTSRTALAVVIQWCHDHFVPQNSTIFWAGLASEFLDWCNCCFVSESKGVISLSFWSPIQNAKSHSLRSSHLASLHRASCRCWTSVGVRFDKI